ncbi:hypothetical protein [Streptomyces sp. NPDC051162]|uniref:hypothetical protein n=1 Tax=unclassified Streptomyces TaxID=2593676 RepID=UPI0034166953
MITSLARPVVPVAGTSGFHVITLSRTETCTTCILLARARWDAETRHDWTAMRDMNSLLADHRHRTHQPVEPSPTRRRR